MLVKQTNRQNKQKAQPVYGLPPRGQLTDRRCGPKTGRKYLFFWSLPPRGRQSTHPAVANFGLITPNSKLKIGMHTFQHIPKLLAPRALVLARRWRLGRSPVTQLLPARFPPLQHDRPLDDPGYVSRRLLNAYGAGGCGASRFHRAGGHSALVRPTVFSDLPRGETSDTRLSGLLKSINKEAT
jgi:hypothetical protein